MAKSSRIYTAEEKENHRSAYKEYIKARKRYHQELGNGEWQNISWNEFLNLVTQKEEIHLSPDYPHCPFCNSDELEFCKREETLVASYGIYDSNHHWIHYKCKKCNELFIMEYNGCNNAKPLPRYNVWYTQCKKVLKGIPTCFESYLYTCRYCGGNVQRQSEDEIDVINYYNCHTKPKIIFKCLNCKEEVKSSNNYFCWDSPHRPKKPFKPRMKLRLGWKIYEEVGIAVIN